MVAGVERDIRAGTHVTVGGRVACHQSAALGAAKNREQRGRRGGLRPSQMAIGSVLMDPMKVFRKKNQLRTIGTQLERRPRCPLGIRTWDPRSTTSVVRLLRDAIAVAPV